MKFRRPCIECGQLTNPGESRCNNHRITKSQYYNKDYKKLSAYIRATATTCHLCGQGAKPNDPWTADHIEPGNMTSPLAAAHRSCNSARGNTPLE